MGRLRTCWFFFLLPAEQLTRSAFNVLGTLVLWYTFLMSFKKLSHEKKLFYLYLSLLIFPDSRILNIVASLSVTWRT